MPQVWKRIEDYSLLLLVGALAALVWVNAAPESYHRFIDLPLWRGGPVGSADASGERVLTLHFLVNDMLMAFFFALAGKEVWEAVALKGGALRGRRAVTPLIATSGA